MDAVWRRNAVHDLRRDDEESVQLDIVEESWRKCCWRRDGDLISVHHEGAAELEIRVDIGVGDVDTKNCDDAGRADGGDGVVADGDAAGQSQQDRSGVTLQSCRLQNHDGNSIQGQSVGNRDVEQGSGDFGVDQISNDGEAGGELQIGAVVADDLDALVQVGVGILVDENVGGFDVDFVEDDADCFGEGVGRSAEGENGDGERATDGGGFVAGRGTADEAVVAENRDVVVEDGDGIRELNLICVGDESEGERRSGSGRADDVVGDGESADVDDTPIGEERSLCFRSGHEELQIVVADCESVEFVCDAAGVARELRPEELSGGVGDGSARVDFHDEDVGVVVEKTDIDAVIRCRDELNEGVLRPRKTWAAEYFVVPDIVVD